MAFSAGSSSPSKRQLVTSNRQPSAVLNACCRLTQDPKQRLPTEPDIGETDSLNRGRVKAAMTRNEEGTNAGQPPPRQPVRAKVDAYVIGTLCPHLSGSDQINVGGAGGIRTLDTRYQV